MVGGYTPRYTTLGTPPWVHHILTYTSMPYMLSPSVARCGTRGPWAQDGETSWVEGLSDPKVLKSVTVRGRLCAELLRLPGNNLGTIG